MSDTAGIGRSAAMEFAAAGVFVGTVGLDGKALPATYERFVFGVPPRD